MSQLQLAVASVERDLRILLSDAFLLAVMFANFTIDLFITAATFGRLVRTDYFLFIAPGSNFVTAAVAAFQSGRDIWREKHIKDLTSYLLTLPVSRPLLALSRVSGGVLRSLIITFPGTLIISYLYGILFDLRVLVAFLLVGLFAMSIVGLSIAISAFASKIEVFVTLRSTVQLFLSFFSTVFYPATVFPSFAQSIVLSNPMTWTVEAFRGLKTGVFLEPLSVLIPTAIGFAGLGIVVYLWYARL